MRSDFFKGMGGESITRGDGRIPMDRVTNIYDCPLFKGDPEKHIVKRFTDGTIKEEVVVNGVYTYETLTDEQKAFIEEYYKKIHHVGLVPKRDWEG